MSFKNNPEEPTMWSSSKPHGNRGSESLEDMKMKKCERTKSIAVHVIMALMGLAAIVFVIISMVTDKVTPYLAISLGLSSSANIFGCIYKNRKRDREDGSCENRDVS